MGGFSINLGSWSEAKTELWAVICGLRMAWEHGVQNILVEMDSLLVTKWLNRKETSSGRVRNLKEKCTKLIQQQWEVEIQHVYHEVNHISDLLANLESCIYDILNMFLIWKHEKK